MSKTIIAALPDWLESGLGLAYPPLCQVCLENAAGRKAGYVCGPCTTKVSLIADPCCERCGTPFEGEVHSLTSCGHCRGVSWHIDHARAAARFSDPLSQVIHQFKYAQANYFEPFLKHLLQGVVSTVLSRENFDCVIPVPLHPLKERERGFNQSEPLAASVARQLGLPMNNRAVRRVRFTDAQAGLSRSARLRNVAGAFAPHPTASASGERVLLIDDVMTTGATLNACAKALRAAGAARVVACTVARALGGTLSLSPGA